MSIYLSAKNLSLAFQSSPLFSHVNLTVNRGEKIGLIGHNGCGKSSLLKLLTGQLHVAEGQISRANHCVLAYVEQTLPDALASLTALKALQQRLPAEDAWQADIMLTEMGFTALQCHSPVEHLSGGQQMRLLLARAVISKPDLLLLDEPSNHLDLPSLLWLERFLLGWQGAFVLISHDQTLLDKVTRTTWIMRDNTLLSFSLPCSQARQALQAQDEADLLRHQSEQKEIRRIEQSAKRLALWGKEYDNEDLARKAKTMLARAERLEAQQTRLTSGAPWTLTLHGEALPANRLLEIESLQVKPDVNANTLFSIAQMRIKSGDRIALMAANGCGKSSLLNLLDRLYHQPDGDMVRYHAKCRLGYYDQTLHQLADEHTLVNALVPFAALSDETRKQALISAGFAYARHQERVASLSGGERARLLFVGLTLARFHLLLLDEPTNHLDLEGKEELIATLKQFHGGALIVSHDRSLLQECCNRFWLIHDSCLVEYASIDAVYAQMVSEWPAAATEGVAEVKAPLCKAGDSEEALLTRLIELETLLSDDLQRKAKHQKPGLQARWRQQIAQINRQLS